MKLVYFGAVIAAAGLLLGSCQHEVLPKVNASDICFERDVLPIFVSNCAMSGCHDAGTAAEDYILTNYATIMAEGIRPGRPENSKIWEEIEENEMPPNHPLTAEQKSIIKTWIAAGAPNGVNCTSNCDSSKFTYSEAVSPIITKNCVGCHQYPSASGSVDLSSYQGVRDIAKSGAFVHSVQGTNGYKKMPPSGAGLSECEINQIKKWVANGAQQN
jgi:hypothetical protein